jgi:hypothetical protein
MSNFEEELRAAMRREEPSPDFTANVLGAISARKAAKARRWKLGLPLFELMRMEWMAVGLAACLILALGVVGYKQFLGPRRSPGAQGQQATGPIAAPVTDDSPKPVVSTPTGSERILRTHHHFAPTAARQRAMEAEALKATEQLKLALYITSSKLSIAQKAMQRMDEGADVPQRDEHQEILENQTK